MEQKVSFDYFYGTQADQYSFYRIPRRYFRMNILETFPVMRKSFMD